MIKKILITLLCLCISFNVYPKKKNEVKKFEPIEVTNIFTCFDLNLATLTNGDQILCDRDLVNNTKTNYDRNKAIEEIHACLVQNNNSTDYYRYVAILTLHGLVLCINND